MVKKNKPVYLCGFMGCGKSTVGKLLAARMGCEFYDMDDYICRKENMSIPEIFSAKGEEYFRQAESAVFEEFKGKTGVIATGGGALLSEKNAAAANSSGVTVFIDAPFESCYERIKDDSNRPIAYNSTKEQLLARYNDRYPLYKAHSQVSCSGEGSPFEITENIIQSISIFF